MANHQLIINLNPVIINLPIHHRAFGDPANHQPIINRFAIIISPTARKCRHVAQPICRQFADHSWKFADSAGFGFVESTDSLPILVRNLPIFALAELRNPSIIDRQNHRIDRSGCRNRSVESSRNHQIDLPVDRSSGSWNLSTIHHQNAEIYHRADRLPATRLLESSDNGPINSGNRSRLANLPIINRQIFAIYRSFNTNKLRAQLRKHVPLPHVA